MASPLLLTNARKGDIIMAEDNFNYDPEHDEETGAAKYRLPFALCKSHGIEVQDWWTPRDAWNALKNGGHVEDVSEEYKEYYRQKKREQDKLRRKREREYLGKKNKQLANPDHNPDKNYKHKDGYIAGAKKGKPMTFAQADSGNCNPYFKKGIGYADNCQTSVAVFVARRKGYDVRALPNLNNRNIYELSYNTALAYVDQYGRHPNKLYKQPNHSTVSFLEKTVKEGRIYTLEFDNVGRRYGHIVTIERIGGKLQIYDPQSNLKITSMSKIKSFLVATKRHCLMDLTEFNIDESFCDKIMKRR